MKKRSLKASFVVTFAGSAAALAAPGCIGNVSNPPEITTSSCPESAPVTGDNCSTPGLTCSYAEVCGNPEMKCSSDGVWVVEYTVSCNPPPVLYCPAEMPIHGDPSCFGEGTCNYTDECGLAVSASCPAGAWEVVSEGVCNPPAPCNLFGTPEECGTTGYCRWLTPGCGEPDSIPALPQAGCHPLADCADDAACEAGSACKSFMVTPDCVDEGCDACGVAVSVCL